jgi:hypothetical protein
MATTRSGEEEVGRSIHYGWILERNKVLREARRWRKKIPSQQGETMAFFTCSRREKLRHLGTYLPSLGRPEPSCSPCIPLSSRHYAVPFRCRTFRGKSYSQSRTPLPYRPTCISVRSSRVNRVSSCPNIANVAGVALLARRHKRTFPSC